MKNAKQHYEEAAQLLKDAHDPGRSRAERKHLVDVAQVSATLAVASAAIEWRDGMRRGLR